MSLGTFWKTLFTLTFSRIFISIALYSNTMKINFLLNPLLLLLYDIVIDTFKRGAKLEK